MSFCWKVGKWRLRKSRQIIFLGKRKGRWRPGCWCIVWKAFVMCTWFEDCHPGRLPPFLSSTFSPTTQEVSFSPPPRIALGFVKLILSSCPGETEFLFLTHAYLFGPISCHAVWLLDGYLEIAVSFFVWRVLLKSVVPKCKEHVCSR